MGRRASRRRRAGPRAGIIDKLILTWAPLPSRSERQVFGGHGMVGGRSALARGLAMAIGAMSLLPIAPGPAGAASGDGGHAGAHASATVKPRIDLHQPAEAMDLLQDVTHELNTVYDDYIVLKDKAQSDANIQFSMPVSVFGQWASPGGGPGIGELVYSPAITWTPFTNTAIGSGAVDFAFQSNQFWTQATTNSRQARMGLITPPNDWGDDSYQFSQITYTHSFPGNWLALAVGQYSLGQYDGNQYAGDAQANFINYALAQNATQTYANAGTGTYVQIAPTSALQFAGGVQSATDVFGRSVTINGFHDGLLAWFMTAQWTPTFLAGGTYSILYYTQPAVPLQPSASQGVSFSAAQNLTARYGIFIRASNASGEAIPIETSVAFGGIVNDPFGRHRLDQAGLGIAWDKTNKAAVGSPSREAEWVAELYYSYTVFKPLHLTPDVQVYCNPALAPDTSFAVAFTLRATFNF